MDEDASKRSYPLQVQLFIDSYLGNVLKRLETHKETTSLNEIQ